MKQIDLTKIIPTKVHNNIERYAIIKKGDLKSAIQTVNKVTLLPGQSIDSHVHPDCEEIYLFISGSGEMSINDKITAVNQDTCIVVCQGEYHSIASDKKQQLTFCSIRSLLST